MASVKGALSTEKGSCSSSSSPEEQLEYRDASEDLEKWKRKVEEAEDEKSKLLLEKLESEDQKKQAQKEVLSLMALQKNSEASSMDMKKEQEDAISDLMKRNRALTDQLKKCEAILKSKRAEHAALQQKFKINAEIPEKKMVFVRMEKGEMEDTCSVFSINQTPFFVLKGCEALITFEEDEVATKILKQDKCPVMFGKKMVNVKPRPVKLGPSVKFEIHMKVAKKKIRFSNALPVLPEERMRDRLEVSFSKVSRGGGEVDKVAYDKDTGSGQIFFLNSGVAENLAFKNKFIMDVNRELTLNISPSFEYQLKKFQTFRGVTKRTVLLEGIEDLQDEEDQQDTLEIHFQKPRNHGGEVEKIRYLSKGKSGQAYFTEDRVA